MVGRLTVGKSKYAEVESEIWPVIETATALQASLQEAVKDDAAAFEGYMKARRLPRATEEQKSSRIRAIQSASIKAAEVPLEVVRQTMEVFKLAVKVAEIGNVNAISDAGTAAAFCQAALKGAGLNVRINLLGLEKETRAARMLKELMNIEKKAEKMDSALRTILVERGGLDIS
jgi:glutamate formiminotransferase/formiminotetrahydrofolate cyclodeaminase